jgi:hypothetical protein
MLGVVIVDKFLHTYLHNILYVVTILYTFVQQSQTNIVEYNNIIMNTTVLNNAYLSRSDQLKGRMLKAKATLASMGVKEYFPHLVFYYPEYQGKREEVYSKFNMRRADEGLLNKVEDMIERMKVA